MVASASAASRRIADPEENACVGCFVGATLETHEGRSTKVSGGARHPAAKEFALQAIRRGFPTAYLQTFLGGHRLPT